jgi:hypothetical protein
MEEKQIEPIPPDSIWPGEKGIYNQHGTENPPGKNLKRNFLQPTRLSPTPANSAQKKGRGEYNGHIYTYTTVYISHYKTATLSYKYTYSITLYV